MNEALKRYNEVFMDVFGVSEEELGENFTTETIESWDSIGHMNLISSLEEEFDILFESDDLMAFQSYEKGMELLEKYGIEIKD